MCLMQDGNTPLYFASKHGHAELVELLLKRGAHVNQVQHTVINQSMNYIATALHLKLATVLISL